MTKTNQPVRRAVSTTLASISRQKGAARPWKPAFPRGRKVAVANNTVITTATAATKERILTITTASCRTHRLVASNDSAASAANARIEVSVAAATRNSCVAGATPGEKNSLSHKVFFTRKRIAL